MARNIKGEGMCAYGLIIQEIKATKDNFISSLDFVHESRRSNIDARMLAKSSIYSAIGKHVWFASPHLRVFVTPTLI